MMRGSLLILLAVTLLGGCAIFKPGEIPKVAEPEREERPPVTDPTFRPYHRVITEEAVSDTGVFITHLINRTLYYEIPVEELGKDFLHVARIAKAQTGVGFGGEVLGTRMIRWERSNDRVLLRSSLYQIVADTTQAIYEAVRAATFEPIIASFPIETFGRDDSTVVINVTRLFTADVPEITVRERFRGRRVDPERSFIDRVRSFPDNIEVRNVLTMESDRVPADPRLRTISVMYSHSMIRLPEEPMMPRLHDQRIGFFSVRKFDFGIDAQRAEERRYITRWRLEKQDPDAELSEPVKPILFYIDRATPAKWIPWIKKGVEEWLPAFEKAGFKNAITAKLAPSPEEDPDWSPDDARYSTIWWFPSTVQNAMGPFIHDPRSGEILTGTVYMHHNVMNLLRNMYFASSSAVDERARSAVFPDSLMGRLIQLVVAHEIGHTLGFPHNMKASGMVPTDSLRSPTFTRKYGLSPSIMDYAYMNYVAQPGDEAYMFPKVSVYDEFAVEWGYTPVRGSGSPDEERRFLNRIAARQEENPFLLFGHFSPIDPTQQVHAVGDNHVRSSQYGIENINRIMEFLYDAAGDEGDDFQTLRELYGWLVGQRNRMLNHVVSWIGGVYSERKVYGQEGLPYEPVSRERQVEAMHYIVKEGFLTPEYLLDENILRRIEPVGAIDRLKQSHRSLLNSLIREDRMVRMTEFEAMNGNPAEVYRLQDMLADIKGGIWSELDERRVVIDIYRRNLQRVHVEVIKNRLNEDGVLSGESRAQLRGSLREMLESIESAMPRAADRGTKFHLEDMTGEIRGILEPS